MKLTFHEKRKNISVIETVLNKNVYKYLFAKVFIKSEKNL